MTAIYPQVTETIKMALQPWLDKFELPSINNNKDEEAYD